MSAPAKPRLSPRRKLYAQKVLTWINADVARWSTGSIPFKANTFVVCSQAVGFDWHGINTALDDLFHFHKVEIELRDEVQHVRPLSKEVE